MQLPEYEHGGGRVPREDGPVISESGGDSIRISVHGGPHGEGGMRTPFVHIHFAPPFCLLRSKGGGTKIACAEMGGIRDTNGEGALAADDGTAHAADLFPRCRYHAQKGRPLPPTSQTLAQSIFTLDTALLENSSSWHVDRRDKQVAVVAIDTLMAMAST